MGGRETLMCERNIHQLPLSHPQLGTWPTTKACALTGNQTGDLSVCRLVLNPLSHTSQGTSHYFFKGRFYLFIFRERGKEREREGEKHWCVRETFIGCLSNAPSWAPGPQPRHVPQPGIKPATFQFAGWRSNRWPTPARAIRVTSWKITSCGYFLIILVVFLLLSCKSWPLCF